MKLSRLYCKLAFLTVLAAVAARSAEPNDPAKSNASKSLFDGKTLAGWTTTKFGGEGNVSVEEGAIRLEFGSSLTGITYQGQVPTTNYELSLEAQRLDGTDFFCALTFPVDKSHCSLVCGGWGGAVVGLSSIDGRDASENETTQYMSFENKRWYRIRVRVQPERIQAWIDDKRIINQDIRGHRIGVRIEVELCKPLGIAAWETRAAYRNIRLQSIEDAQEKATKD